TSTSGAEARAAVVDRGAVRAGGDPRLVEDRQLLVGVQGALQRCELGVDRIDGRELLRDELGSALAQPVSLEDKAPEVVERELAPALQEAQPPSQHGALEKTGRTHPRCDEVRPADDLRSTRSP